MLLSKINTHIKGKEFKEKVRKALEVRFNTKFSKSLIYIGVSPKGHLFDLVSENGNIIVECKNYSWTVTGNIPSAKTATLNEAVLFLSHAPKNAEKIIVMNKSNNAKRKESLAEYYVRTYFHLLHEIKILELDLRNNTLAEVKHLRT